MEAFLTTLPPYVHEFLDKYPPTDVFNLLRELICFAVLYSEDRDKLNQSTSDFLKKRQQSENKGQNESGKDGMTQEKEKEEEEEEEEEEEDATVPIEKRIDSIAEETEHEIQTLKAKPLYNIRTGEAIQTDKSNMPNTFPEWWGHRESEPHKVERKQTAIHHDEHQDKTLPQSFGTSWISWENQQPNSTPTTTNHRMERARSQIIPDLRSYLAEDSKLTTSRTAPPSNSSSAAANNKKRYSLNTATASKAVAIVPPPNDASTSKAAVTKPKRRISSPPICDSPVTTTAPATASSKFIQTAAKQQQLRQNKTISPSSSGTSSAPPTRSASVILKQPRQNAAMRARAEHARQQQEELERKKNAPAIGSSTSLRLKQRVNSGIDWESIKRDRRKTVAEAPSTATTTKEQ